MVRVGGLMKRLGYWQGQGTALAFLLLCSVCGQAATPVSIIPAPRDVKPATGEFVFSTNTRVAFRDERSEQAARQFVELARRTHGLDLELAEANRVPKGAILFDARTGP